MMLEVRSKYKRLSNLYLNLQALITRQNMVSSIFEVKRAKKEALKEEVLMVKSQLDLRANARLYHQKLVDLVYRNSLDNFTSSLNTLLSGIFYDQKVELKFALEDYRGQKSLSLLVSINESPYMELKHAVGNGIRSVVSFFLLSHVLFLKNSNFLVADEKYSGISEEYLPTFMQAVSRFCKQTGFVFVLITHDNRFFSYADQIYFVKDGKVSLYKESYKM